MKIPFTQSYRMPSDLRLVSGTEHMFKSSLSLPTTNNRRSVSQTNIGLVMDDVVVDALESISGLQYRENTPTPPSPSRRPRLTNLEKSQRFLRHCSSWNQLESKPENKDVLEQQSKQTFLRWNLIIISDSSNEFSFLSSLAQFQFFG